MNRLPITDVLGLPCGLPVAISARKETPSLREVLSKTRSMRNNVVGPSPRFPLLCHLRDQPKGRRPSRALRQFLFATNLDPTSRSAAEERRCAAWPVTVLAASMVAGPHPRAGNDA